MNAKLLPLLIASALALIALAACAPMNGPGGPREGASGPGDKGGGPVAQIQSQLQQTAEALNLTPRQRPLWEAYQEQVGALMADQMKLQSYSSSRQNAPQQIAQKVGVVRNRLAAIEDVQDAANTLYVALDEQQKKVADQKLAQTVPALYSGFVDAGASGERGDERPARPDKRGGQGGMGRSGGGMGGGMGGM